MNRLEGLLGLARASRNLSYGESVIKDIRSQKSKFVLIAEDASMNTKKKISDKCKYYHISYGFIEHSEWLSRAVGRNNIKAVSISDLGFAQQIEQILKG